MRLFIFLVLSRYGLACKYRIISKYQDIAGCRIAFSDISDIAFSYFFRSNYSLLRQVRWFVT